MIAYPDASLLVALFMDETGTDRAARWLDSHVSGRIASSAWTNVEVLSAVGIRRRKGDISRDRHQAVLLEWQQLERSFEPLPVAAIAFHDASLWLAQCELGLRSGDALHLAVAKAAHATVWSLDRTMVRAGRALGLAVEAP